MRQDGKAALLMDGRCRFRHRHLLRDRLCHPQSQHMAFNGRYFHAGDHIKRIPGAPFISPQAGIQHIMIGDRNHIQMAATGHIIQHLPHRRHAITGAGVHVYIRAARR